MSLTRLRYLMNEGTDDEIEQYLMNLGLGYGAPMIGTLVYWPVATLPQDLIPELKGMVFLKCNGQVFDGATYPKLAKVIPSLRLPDVRGEFIRCWDDGRGVDSGRAVLSSQSDIIKKHIHPVVENDALDSINNWYLGTIFRTDYTQGRGIDAGTTLIPPPTMHSKGTIGYNRDGGTETRPRNIAFHTLVRAK